MFYDRHITDNLIDSQKTFPSVLVTGPRQVGKTTIIKHLYPNIKFVSLDSNATKTAAQEDPAGFLQLQGTPLILDEVQKVPELLAFRQKLKTGKKRGFVCIMVNFSCRN